MMDFIQYGSEKIEYYIHFVDRKSLGIKVFPNRKVEIKAPLHTSLNKVQEKVRKRAPWILKQKDHFLSFEPRITERKYISGETHLYLGRQYQLRVIKADTNKVKYTGRFLEVYTIDKSKAQNLLEGWYRQKAEIWFKKLSQIHIERFKKYQVEPTRLEIKKMKYRWGSCSSKGRILLNPELIKAPKACIEYVIIHELCHLIHRDHTKAFFNLQTHEMPDWEKWKMKLETLLA
ncbi:M48 family metallopeptidase [Tenacibaculum larymnensis]|uniref:M48 family metallopeptidase n=1 Tax=Tenacibaculum larymnensis TaxID=2878201 RepID=A0A9X4IQE1_9FLAO|nr:SprT family zinc-dependent metalloprotease [Tenacibaculum larymnensis]MDE1207101.1 M48 family metallopeptidase [Tenacibaculum larymnensis]